MDEVVSSNKLSLTAKEQQKKEIEQVSLSSDVDIHEDINSDTSKINRYRSLINKLSF